MTLCRRGRGSPVFSSHEVLCDDVLSCVLISSLLREAVLEASSAGRHFRRWVIPKPKVICQDQINGKCTAG